MRLDLSKPASSNILPQARLHFAITSLNSPLQCGPSFPISDPMGDISLSNNHNSVPVTFIVLQTNSTSPVLQITTHLVLLLGSINW